MGVVYSILCKATLGMYTGQQVACAKEHKTADRSDEQLEGPGYDLGSVCTSSQRMVTQSQSRGDHANWRCPPSGKRHSGPHWEC